MLPAGPLLRSLFRGLLRGVLLARPKVTTFGAGFNLRPLPCPLRPPPRPPLRLAPRPAVVRPLLCAPLLCARCCAPRCCAPRFSVPRRVTRAPPWRHTGPCSSRHTSTPSAESVWGCDCSPHRTSCKRSHWAAAPAGCTRAFFCARAQVAWRGVACGVACGVAWRVAWRVSGP